MSLHKQAIGLAIMHVAEVLQPLIILPYAARTLGPFSFGQYAYALSIAHLAATVVEYGFYWSAQRTAASARQDPAAIATLFAEVITAKAALFFAVTVGGLITVSALLGISTPLFFCAMLTPLGVALFPVWLLIALERSWQASVAVVVARLIALAAFLSIVTSPAQVELAVAIQASIPLISAVVALPFIIPIGFAGFRTLTLYRVGMQFRNGWHGFVVALARNAAIALPVSLVGHFAGYATAGQYSVADRVVSATRPFFKVLSDTLMPRVAYYAHHEPAKGLELIWNSLWTVLIGCMLSLALFILGPFIIVFLFGPDYSGAIELLKTLAILPILMNVNICTSSLYMFNYRHERAWTSLTVSGLLTFVGVAYVLSYIVNGALAVAIGVIAGECIVVVVSAAFFLASGANKSRVLAAQGVENA